MKLTSPRRALARSAAGLGLAVTLAATGVLSATAAQAQTVTSGSFGFSGPKGEYITQGKSYHYATDRFTVTGSTNHHGVGVSVPFANGDWWYLSLKAPGSSALAPGLYTGATNDPLKSETQPSLDLGGEGRGCNTLTGSFAISKLVWGPNGYVQTLEATFQMHCEGFMPAVNGRIIIHNAPAPN